jgi:TrmH family RNA methyltransferase
LIESLGSTHQSVRRLRRLIQKRSERWSEGVCVIEGPDLVEAAIETGAAVEAVYIDESALDLEQIKSLCVKAANSGVRIFSLATGVLEKVSDALTPQPIMATVRMHLVALADLPTPSFALVLHDIRDPGNAGTLIRSADASGASAVILTGQSVDPYNPKTLRATAGSVFRVPLVMASLGDAVAKLKEQGVSVLATVVRGGVDSRSVDFTVPTAVVIGNESQGLSIEEVAMCSGAISIPMAGGAESLNAGIAGSLLAFAAFYQRLETNGRG